MFKGRTVLSQMQSIIFGYDFKKIINEHSGDKGIRVLSIRNLMSVMLFVQMASKQSLRDIVYSLQSKTNLWYHLGLISVSRNNLAYALKNRPAEIFEKTFYLLLARLQNERGRTHNKRFTFKMPVRSIDSTTISLCLSLFDWARFRRAKGGIKLHVMYNNREQIPEFVNITTASGHDSTAADSFPISSGSVYAMDKGYICFKFFQKIARKGAYFVTRTKTNTQYRKIGRRLNTQKNIRADWIVELTGLKSKEYPEKLRIIRSYDHETKRVYEFLTNNFKLSAQSIADVYKARWDIELFFRWIKQNLKIKTFIGTSENAVMIQIWTAMIACLLTVYMRFKSRSTFSLLNVFRLISDNLLFSIDIFHLLSIKPPSSKQYDVHHDFQLAWNF